MNDTNRIRMAALIYGETEGIKKKITIHKRIVEAVFIAVENVLLEEKDIQTYAQEFFDIYIAIEEIIEVVEGKKGKVHFIKDVDNRTIKYCLSNKRKR